MPGNLAKAVKRIHRLAGGGAAVDSDAALLERFAEHRDEAAFAALVQRHGRMVWNICYRLLGHRQEAEDAYQATFLVLARKAAAPGWRESIANWLYGVATRVAWKARTARGRMRLQEMGDWPQAEPVEPQWQEMKDWIDEELNRLPEKDRAPLVLCYLEGKSNEEAARQLGWPVGTLWSQLSRGRERLRKRLARRGLTLSSAMLATVLGQNAAIALEPPTLAGSTIQIAVLSSSGSAGAVAAPVDALVQGVLRSMFLRNLRIATVFLLATFGTIAVGAITVHALADKPVVAPEPTTSGVTKVDGAKIQPVLEAETDQLRVKLDRGYLAIETSRAGVYLGSSGNIELEVLNRTDEPRTLTVEVLRVIGPGATNAALEFPKPVVLWQGQPRNSNKEWDGRLAAKETKYVAIAGLKRDGDQTRALIPNKDAKLEVILKDDKGKTVTLRSKPVPVYDIRQE